MRTPLPPPGRRPRTRRAFGGSALARFAPVLFVGAVAVGSLVAVACGGGGGGGGGGGSGGGGGPAPFGLESRVPVTSLTFPLTPPTSFSIEAYDGFPGVRFSSPVFVTAAPGDASRLFVVEQSGRIRVFPMSPSVTPSQVTTFLNLTSQTTAGGEMGLLGLAFDPNYATNRRFYVNYTTGTGATLRSVVSRFLVSTTDPNVADTAETILFTVSQPFTNHNGGMLAFGPDGFLYGSFGDGGSGGDPGNNGQNRTTLLGKIIRIDPNSGSPYAIPADNPFASSTGPERKEIYAWGMRNPWRFSFDRGTGNLWAGDVGQGTREEIDLVRKGGNYGWRAMEGNAVYDGSLLGNGPFDTPVLDYPRSLGTVVIGGYVYRGTAIGSLVGQYLYSDYGTGRMWSLGWNGSAITSNVEVASVPSVTSYGEDAAGDLLATDYSLGRILRFRTTSPSATPFPATLSATGIYASTSTLALAPGLVPYDVRMALHSDDAIKDRAIAVPGVEQIGWSRDGAWTFPVGTTFVKTFRLPLTAGNPATAVKVETRVLLQTTNGLEGYSYRWRNDQTDADLLPGASTRSFTISDPAAPGGQRVQTWQFPSRADCLRCHTAAAGRVLGVNTRQLNGTFDYAVVGGVPDNQLRTWGHIGLFAGAVPVGSSLPAHPALSDAGASVASRARAYLEVNCSMCHRPGGPTPVAMDLRSTVPASSMGVVNVAPTQGSLGYPSPLLVHPTNHANSMLWIRTQRLDAFRMPPLATSLVDPAGAAIVAQWIDEGGG